MLARLSLRFVLVLLLTGAATIALVTMFEAVIRAPLSFGTALAVVMPLLIAARSCGAAWVSRHQTRAGARAALRYGAWFALLALAIMLLHGAGLRLWLGLDVTEPARMLASRPGTGLALAVLAYATTALITISGFSLGARAQARLLPQRSA